MPRFPCGGFDRNLPFLRQRRHMRGLDLAFEVVLLRQPLHKQRITIRFVPTQAMIEVAEDQIRKSRLTQQVQQRH